MPIIIYIPARSPSKDLELKIASGTREGTAGSLSEKHSIFLTLKQGKFQPERALRGGPRILEKLYKKLY